MSDNDAEKPESVHDDSRDLQESLVFRYNRDRRLAHAPEMVQKAYQVGYTPNKGFIKGLTANAGLRSIFITIIILCAVIGGITFLGNPPGTGSAAGCNLKLKAFLYEETVYITLTCTQNTAKDVTIPVTAMFSASGTDDVIVSAQEVQGNLKGKELILRTTMTDFEITKVNARVHLGNDETSLTVAVDRK